jgi:hypothetical protein
MDMPDPNHGRTVTLWNVRDERGNRAMWARRLDDGGLMIEGQDLGKVVSEAWGAGLTEYEWAWKLPAADVPRVSEALGGSADEDPLAVLMRWSREHEGRDPGIPIKEAGLPIEFWSRVGD